MSDLLKIINHQGKKILISNFANLKEQEIIDGIEQSEDLMIKNKVNLLIIDVTNTTTSKLIREKSTEVLTKVEAKVGTVYSALIGIRLAQQILANLIKKDSYFTSNIEDAKNWLVKKARKTQQAHI